jgi:hypothetical protein
MPLQTFTDKNGNKKTRYVRPSANFQKSSRRPKRLSLEDIGMKTPTRPRLSDDEKEESRRAAFNRGGKFENNFFRNALPSSVSNFLYNLDERNQLNRLNQFPEQRSDRFANVQQNIRDAASNEGFNFDRFFNTANVDRRDPNEVRPFQSNDGNLQDISGEVTKTDILRGRPGISEEDILRSIGNTQFDPRAVNPILTAGAGFGDTALAEFIDPNRFNAFRTNEAYSTSNRPAGLGGLLYDALGGTTVDEVLSTYPDNTEAFNIMKGNTSPSTNLGVSNTNMGGFSERPPPGMRGLLTPTFNFDIAPFGGTGFYDSILSRALADSAFGGGINVNPNLPASTAGFGTAPTGTINIGNLGTVTDQFGRELFGQEREDFINNEFAKLQQEKERLRNLSLNILR